MNRELKRKLEAVLAETVDEEPGMLHRLINKVQGDKVVQGVKDASAKVAGEAKALAGKASEGVQTATSSLRKIAQEHPGKVAAAAAALGAGLGALALRKKLAGMKNKNRNY